MSPVDSDPEGQDRPRNLSRIQRTFKMLAGCNQVVIREEDEGELLRRVCAITVETGGYSFAWVGFTGEEPGNWEVLHEAHAGMDEEFLESLRAGYAKNSRGPLSLEECPVVLCGGVLIKDLENQEQPRPWHQLALAHGLRCLACLPLRDKNGTIGILCLCSREALSTDGVEVELLQELADNLAFGIGNLRAKRERQRLLDAVLKIAQGVSAGSGDEIFDLLTAGLVETTRADGGMIGRFMRRDEAEIHSVSYFMEGAKQPNVSYGLQGTPCENVISKEICVIESGVRELYPEDLMLVEMGIETYAGCPLRDAAGKVTGIMVLLFRKTVERPELVKSILQIFATRAASELERRLADAKVREQAALLDKARDAITVRNLEHGITYWNKSAERLYGWSAEEATGLQAELLLHHDPSVFLEAHERLMETGEWNGELQHRRKDGVVITVEARWTLVRDEAGRPYSVLGINTDITERKKIEAHFLRAQRVESIGTLAGGIAHDLNNVLAPIIMSIDLLDLTAADERSRELLSTIRTSARRGAEMVGQVLSFARGVEGQRVELNPRHLIADIQKIARDTFPKNIGIMDRSEDDLPRVFGDPTQLHRVLLNLCVNARDAMPDGGRILIHSRNLKLDPQQAEMNAGGTAGDYLVIEVEDTGSGIEPEILDKIFDPFFTTKELRGGTGLGLSTSLAIIRGHGGFMRVYSEPGNGTRFGIYLPACAARSDSAPTGARADLPRGNGETILVVDDEPAIREVAKRTLEAFGYKAWAAADGKKALALCATRMDEISLVLTDMMMPVMDGQAVIRTIAAIYPRARVIATSGIGANAEVAFGCGAVVKGFLQKPYSAETLLQIVHKVLGENPEVPRVAFPAGENEYETISTRTR